VLDGEAGWLTDQEDSLQMLARTLALSIERELLADQNRRNLMARESERLGRVLLNTVSHELRTPLTTIKGSVTALMEPAAGSDAALRGVLLAETLGATDRLNAIVENLLNMSRLESGMLKPRKSPTDVFDLVSVVADALERQSREHPLSLQVDGTVSTISVDFILMVQVLSNLLSNAARHTPPGTAVQLVVGRRPGMVVITVSDEGPGVPPDELPRLFEPFFRGRAATAGGVGLGLSLCKGIVEAHGGGVAAYVNRAGGLSVSVSIPDPGEGGSPA
jgi:two-component system, OmpR family, sensor histidine kinase KdpD